MFLEEKKICLYIFKRLNYYNNKRLYNYINNCRFDIGGGGSQKSHKVL